MACCLLLVHACPASRQDGIYAWDRASWSTVSSYAVKHYHVPTLVFWVALCNTILKDGTKTIGAELACSPVGAIETKNHICHLATYAICTNLMNLCKIIARHGGWLIAIECVSQPNTILHDCIWHGFFTIQAFHQLLQTSASLGNLCEIQTTAGAAVEHKPFVILPCSATPCLYVYTSATIQVGGLLMWDQCPGQ